MSNEAYNGQLDQFNYQELAQRTSAPATPEMFKRALRPELMCKLVDTLQAISLAADQLDKIKKHIFYGKEFNYGLEGYEPHPIACKLLVNERRIKILHGILGVATEAGEMVDALLGFLVDGEDFDNINIKEEAGDNQWYIAELLAGAGANFNEVHRTNIAKLVARYGDKYSDYRAINRDLEAERVALEADTHEKTETSET